MSKRCAARLFLVLLMALFSRARSDECDLFNKRCFRLRVLVRNVSLGVLTDVWLLLEDSLLLLDAESLSLDFFLDDSGLLEVETTLSAVCFSFSESLDESESKDFF